MKTSKAYLMGQFFQPFVDTVSSVLRFPVSIWVHGETENELRVAATTAFSQGYAENAFLTIGEPSIAGDVMRSGKTRFIKDIAKEPSWKYKEEAQGENLKSAVVVPLYIKDKVIGVLDIYIPRDQSFNLDQQLPVIESLARQIATNYRQVRGLQTLDEVQQLVSSELKDPMNLLGKVVASAQTVLECEHVTIFFLSDDGSQFIRKATSSPRLKRTAFQADEGLIGKVKQLGKSLLVHNVKDHPEFLPGITSPGTTERSMVVVPIFMDTKFFGVISADEKKLKGFDEFDLMLLENIASQAAIAIRNSQLYTQSETLQEVSGILNSTLENKEVINVILEQLQHVIGYHTASIQLLENGKRRLIGIKGAMDDRQTPDLLLEPSKDRLIQKIVGGKKPIVLSNVREHPDLWKVIPETDHVQSWIGIPLVVKNEVIGLLTIDHSIPGYYSEQTLEIAAAFGNHAATALSNSELYQQLSEQLKVLSELNKISPALISFDKTTDIGTLLQDIAESARMVLKADLIELYEYDQEQEDFRLPQITCGKILSPVTKKVIELDDAVATLIEHHEPLFLEKAQVVKNALTAPYTIDRPDQPDKRFVYREGIQSVAIIPLRTADDTMGLMFANFRFEKRFTKNIKEVIQIFANQAAIAIKNIRMFKQAVEQAEALAELNKVANYLLTIQESDPRSGDLLQQIAESARKTLDADLVILYEYREYREKQRKYVLPPITAGHLHDESVLKQEIYEDDAVFQLIHQPAPLFEKKSQGRHSIFNQPYVVKRKDIPDKRFVLREGIISTAAIPLRSENETLGLIFINYRSSQQFNEEQRERITLFANMAAMAIHNARLYYYMDQRREALTRMGNELISGELLTEDKVLRTIYDQASTLLGMKNMSIALYDEAKDTVTFKLASIGGELIDFSKQAGWESRTGGNGKTERIIKSRQPLLLATKEEVKDAGFNPAPNHKDYVGELPNSWLGVPMMAGNKVLGVIANYQYGIDHFYTENHIKILQTLANQAANAIDNNRPINALIDFGSNLNAKISEGEDEIFNFIHQQADRFMDTDNMFIALYDAATDEVSFPLIFKAAERIQVPSRRGGKGRTEEIIRTGEPIFITSREESLQWYNDPSHERVEYIGDHLASWIGVPMKAHGKVIGVIATFHPTKANRYNKEDLDTLQVMADLAAIALENHRLYDQELAEELEQARKNINQAEQQILVGSFTMDILHRVPNLVGTIPIRADNLLSKVEKSGLDLELKQEILKQLNGIKEDAITLMRSVKEWKPMKEFQQKKHEDVGILLNSAIHNTIIPDNIRIDFNVPEGLPLVYCNPKQLYESFLCVVENGVQAMGTQEGTLTVKAKLIGPNENNRLLITIADSGPGIPDNIQKKIFDLYFTTKTNESGASGLGYGLWRAKAIIQAMNGSIEVESTKGKGATFKIILPASVK
ncbi:MAG: GAF domain-containing protein [Calditrichaeota bacterium]|nr:GAF domain-containing protein [Calditrichota bacterium]